MNPATAASRVDTVVVDFTEKTCQETSGMVGDRYIRCGARAFVLLKYRGRDEGPYFMCLACGDHNIRNRNAEALAIAPSTPQDFVERWGFIVDAEPVDSTVNPLAIIERYAQEDLILHSDEFLEMVERTVAKWGTEHERQIDLIVTKPTTCTDGASYAQLGDDLKEAAERQKATEAFWKPRKSLFDKVHAIICGRENQMLKTKLLPWMARVKASRLELEQEDARRRREQEQRLAEQARRDEEERLAREAEAFHAAGHTEMAEQVLEQAVAVETPVVVLPSTLPQTQGIGSRANWKWRPVGGDDPKRRAMATDIVARWLINSKRNASEYTSLDDKKINAAVKAHGNALKIPGIEIYDAGTVSVRS
jgi:hypothetical protein